MALVASLSILVELNVFSVGLSSVQEKPLPPCLYFSYQMYHELTLFSFLNPVTFKKLSVITSISDIVYK